MDLRERKRRLAFSCRPDALHPTPIDLPRIRVMLDGDLPSAWEIVVFASVF